MAGTGDKIKGKANESVGKVTGDKKRELKGKAQQAKGSVMNMISAKQKEMELSERVSGAVSHLRDRTADAIGVEGGMGHGELAALGRKVDRLESAVSDRVEAYFGSLGEQLSQISAEGRSTTWPRKFFWLLGGAGIGAAAMYLRDPDHGEDRRSELTDQVTERSRKAARSLKVEAREVVDRARGKVVETVEDVLETKPDDGSE